MSVIKKIITKSNSHQIKTKTKQLNLYFVKKDMSPVPQCDLLTGRQKEQIGAKFKNTFPFLKTINFAVINVIRY